MTTPTLARCEAVLWRRVHGGVIVRPIAGEALVLAAEGADLWDLLDQPRDMDHVVDQLCRSQPWRRPAVAAALDEAVLVLVAQGVLSWT